MISRLGLGSGQGSGCSQTRRQTEPAPEQQPPEPVNAVADYADGPSRPTPRVKVRRSQGLGRCAQIARRNPPGVGVLHPGAIGQGQQRCHRQHEPMPRDARRVGPAGLVPLPAQALERLEAQFDPAAQRVPTHPDCFRRKVGEDDPWFLLLGVPDRQQGATAFAAGAPKAAPLPIHAVSGRERYPDGKRRRARAAGGRPRRRR